MTKRPCECGCRFEDHEKAIIRTLLGKGTIWYCTICDNLSTFCYNYRPIGNLEWLEYLYDKTH